MTIEETRTAVDEIRVRLGQVKERMDELLEAGVVLDLNVASDQKTVDVKATTAIEITIKGTINQCV